MAYWRAKTNNGKTRLLSTSNGRQPNEARERIDTENAIHVGEIAGAQARAR